MELLDWELDPNYLLDKAARLDILARTATGVLVNVEVQIANKYNIDKPSILLGRTLPRTVDQRPELHPSHENHYHKYPGL